MKNLETLYGVAVLVVASSCGQMIPDEKHPESKRSGTNERRICLTPDNPPQPIVSLLLQQVPLANVAALPSDHAVGIAFMFGDREWGSSLNLKTLVPEHAKTSLYNMTLAGNGQVEVGSVGGDLGMTKEAHLIDLAVYGKFDAPPTLSSSQVTILDGKPGYLADPVKALVDARKAFDAAAATHAAEIENLLAERRRAHGRTVETAGTPFKDVVIYPVWKDDVHAMDVTFVQRQGERYVKENDCPPNADCDVGEDGYYGVDFSLVVNVAVDGTAMLSADTPKLAVMPETEPSIPLPGLPYDDPQGIDPVPDTCMAEPQGSCGDQDRAKGVDPESADDEEACG